jgi:hypothetical protein
MFPGGCRNRREVRPKKVASLLEPNVAIVQTLRPHMRLPHVLNIDLGVTIVLVSLFDGAGTYSSIS